MAERDGSAIDVDARRIERQRTNDGENLRCEGLIELDEVNIVELESGERERFGGVGDGADAHFSRQTTGDGIRYEPRKRLNAELARAAGFHEDDGGGSVRG